MVRRGGSAIRVGALRGSLGPSLPRTRLVQRLLQLPPGGVALVVAPTGYGGTVLMHEAAARSPAATVSLAAPSAGRGHDEFWATAHAALSAAGIDTPAMPTTDRLAEWESFAAALTQGLAAGPDLLLLLEDLGPDPAFDQQVQILVDALPATVRLMIRARRTPHLDVSHLLARGRLVLLDRWDLALSPEEADEYVASLAPSLPSAKRAALVESAEGWIGALQAALNGSSQGADQSDPAAWLEGPGLDLLFGRWLSGLDAEDADLLVRTSVLDLLSPDACDRLCARSDSGSRLARLAEEQVVVPPAGAAGPQYRCHRLLRTYLRRELAARGRTAVAHAHAELGRWLVEQDDIDGAITHLLDSGQVDEARSLLNAHVGTLIDSGLTEQVRDWYRRKPQLAGTDREMGVLGAAWSELLAGDVPAAESHLVELDAAVAANAFLPSGAEPASEGVEWLRTEADYLRAHLFVWGGNTVRAQDLVRQVRSRYGDDWSRTAPQSAAMMELRIDLWHGQDESARAELHLVGHRPGTLEHFRRMTLPSLRAYLAASDGRAHRARFLAEQGLGAIAEAGVIGVMDSADALLARARALLDLGEDRLALADAVEVETRAARAGHVTYHVLAICLRALATGWVAGEEHAQTVLEEARQVLRERAAGNSLRAAVDATGVELAVHAGDRNGARRDLARLPEGPVRDRLSVQVAGMGGGLPYADAMKLVRSVRPSVPRDVVDARMLMAAVTSESRGTEAESHLSAAATIAHEFGMHRALAGRAEVLQILAARLAEADSSPAIAALAASATREPARPAEDEGTPQLSHGERELLDVLVTAGTYRQLAESLGVSVNTVKTRLRRLYAKLGVHDRETALRRVGKAS